MNSVEISKDLALLPDEELQKWYYLLAYILVDPSKDRLYRITYKEQFGIKNVSYSFDWVYYVGYNHENKEWEAKINNGNGTFQLKNIASIKQIDPMEERIKFALLPIDDILLQNDELQPIHDTIKLLQNECKSLMESKTILQDLLNHKIQSIYNLFGERSNVSKAS